MTQQLQRESGDRERGIGVAEVEAVAAALGRARHDQARSTRKAHVPQV
jgi:hypothetical protein